MSSIDYSKNEKEQKGNHQKTKSKGRTVGAQSFPAYRHPFVEVELYHPLAYPSSTCHSEMRVPWDLHRQDQSRSHHSW